MNSILLNHRAFVLKLTLSKPVQTIDFKPECNSFGTIAYKKLNLSSELNL